MSETAGVPRLRPSVEGDEETLWLMLYFASHSNDERGVGPEDIRSNPDLVGYIEGWRRGGRIGVIAEIGDSPIGAAWLRLLVDDDRANPVFMGAETPELAIAVLPDHQGRGVGSIMLSELLSISGHVDIVLSVRADNPAVRLYERFGFEGSGTITNRVGTVSIRMHRPAAGGSSSE